MRSAYVDFCKYGKIPELKQYEQKQNKHLNKIGIDDRVEYTMRMIPPLRKFYNVIDGSKTGCWFTVALMGFRTWNELEEDVHDIKNAVKRVPYDKHKQFPFPVIKTCPIEKFWLGKKLLPYDKTLFDTKLMQKFLIRIGMTDVEADKHGLIEIKGSRAAEYLGGSALRIPLLGATIFAGCELDGVIKADDKLKQIPRSSIKIILTMGMAALLGRLGRYHSRVLELSGLGGGIILGSYLSKKLNAKILPETKKLNKTA
jgi:hypothetical protein